MKQKEPGSLISTESQFGKIKHNLINCLPERLRFKPDKALQMHCKNTQVFSVMDLRVWAFSSIISSFVLLWLFFCFQCVNDNGIVTLVKLKNYENTCP